jgi:mono/diheme cytochrome c family protein
MSTAGGGDDEVTGARPRKWPRRVLIAGAIAAVTLVVIQFVPYRVTNPAAGQEPSWDSPRTRQLAVAACFDCHSNETKTTWWEDIAPLSWWITNHVKEGRDKLNFSEWDGHGGEPDEAAETVDEGSMPPDYYTWLGMHSDAKLTPAERRELADGLRRTLGG